MKRLSCLMISILAFSGLITGQNEDSNKVKGQQILAKAKESLSKKKKLDSIKGLTIISETMRLSSLTLRNGQPVKIEDVVKSESSFDLQNLKIKEKQITDQTNFIGKISDTSQVVEESTLSGDGFSYNRDTFIEGEKINVGVPALSKEQGILNLKKKVFPVLFPITLDFRYLPLEFSYVGIAESKDGKGNIIEAVLDDKTVYQFIFDEKTGLLLMMTQTSVNSTNQKNEQKYFYSDYKEIDGFFVPTRIKSEKKQFNGSIIESQEIRTLKFNPAFKSNSF